MKRMVGHRLSKIVTFELFEGNAIYDSFILEMQIAVCLAPLPFQIRMIQDDSNRNEHFIVKHGGGGVHFHLFVVHVCHCRVADKMKPVIQ